MGNKHSAQINASVVPSGSQHMLDLDLVAREKARNVGEVKIADMDETKFRDGFKMYCVSPNGLSRTNFHEALALLEELGLRRLRDSPLGDLLFDSFDSSKEGFVSEDEFVLNAMIITGRNQRKKIDLTFNSYSKFRPYLLLNEMVEYLVQIWKFAFATLASRFRLSSKDTSPYVEDCPAIIQRFCEDHTEIFREKANKSLYSFSRQSDLNLVIDKEGFALWAATDRTISASFGDTSIMVAVTLLNIDAAVPSMKPPVH